MKVQLLDKTGKVVSQQEEIPDAAAFPDFVLKSNRVFKFRVATGVVSDTAAIGCYVEEAAVVIAEKASEKKAEPPVVPPTVPPPVVPPMTPPVVPPTDKKEK